jgi:hypothetical protein
MLPRPPRGTTPVEVQFTSAGCLNYQGRTPKINNPQQSWGFEWEPPKAVMKDSGTRDWTLWGGKLQLRRLRALGIGTVISSLRLIVETKYALFQN